MRTVDTDFPLCTSAYDGNLRSAATEWAATDQGPAFRMSFLVLRIWSGDTRSRSGGQKQTVSPEASPPLLPQSRAYKIVWKNRIRVQLFYWGVIGLTVVRRPGVEEEYEIHQIQLMPNFAAVTAASGCRGLTALDVLSKNRWDICNCVRQSGPVAGRVPPGKMLHRQKACFHPGFDVEFILSRILALSVLCGQ
jgi:hypothetical protein